MVAFILPPSLLPSRERVRSCRVRYRGVSGDINHGRHIFARWNSCISNGSLQVESFHRLDINDSRYQFLCAARQKHSRANLDLLKHHRWFWARSLVLGNGDISASSLYRTRAGFGICSIDAAFLQIHGWCKSTLLSSLDYVADIFHRRQELQSAQPSSNTSSRNPFAPLTSFLNSHLMRRLGRIKRCASH